MKKIKKMKKKRKPHLRAKIGLCGERKLNLLNIKIREVFGKFSDMKVPNWWTAHFAVLPWSSDRVHICGKSRAVFRWASPDYGSRSKRAYSSLGSRSFCQGHSVLPRPCENRRLSMGFSRDISCSFPVRAYRRFI